MIKIARIAVTLGLLSSLGAQAYAAGLVVNDTTCVTTWPGFPIVGSSI